MTNGIDGKRDTAWNPMIVPPSLVPLRCKHIDSCIPREGSPAVARNLQPDLIVADDIRFDGAQQIERAGRGGIDG
jgi:hypothetical protein